MKLTEKLKTRARKIKADTSALYLALQRKDTPVIAKIVAGFTICMALSPIDLIPDFIPVLGYLDDVLLLPLFIVLAVKLVPSEIMAECREQAEGMWQDGKPVRAKYAVPVIIIWLVVIAVLVKVIFFRSVA